MPASLPSPVRLRTAPGALRASVVVVAAACLPTQPARAQAGAPQPAPAHATLPVVVVSGSRVEQAVDDLPLSADVIGSAQISDRQAATLREALQDLPNVYIKTESTRPGVVATATGNAWRDGNLGINIRGLGGNRVLVLEDGVRLPRAYATRTNVFDREYLGLEQLRRIEIIRGPASALYGSDGMAGLVNFITFDPVDFLRGADGKASKALGGRVAAGWTQDDRGLVATGAVAGQVSEGLQWLVSGSLRRAHELETRGDNAAAHEWRTVANPERRDNGSLLAKVVWRPLATQRHVFKIDHAEHQTRINALSNRSANQPPRKGDVLDERFDNGSQVDRVSWDARYGLQTAWADHLRSVVAFHRSAADQWAASERQAAPLRVREVSYDDRSWQLGLQADKIVRPGAWSHRIVYGVEYTHSRLGNLWDGLDPNPPEVFPLKRFPDTRETSAAFFVQDESHIGRWSFTPGVRLDRFAIDVVSQDGFYPPAKAPGQSLSGSAVSPKFGVLYQVTPQWALFGQYASGFRAPEAGHLNGYLEVDKVKAVVLSNPNLKPERSRGLELGLRGRTQSLQFDTAVFASHYTDLIAELEAVSTRVVPNPPGPPTIYTDFQTVNKARARIWGYEFKGRYDWGLVGGGRLSSSFSYGHTRGVDRDTRKPINSILPAQLALGARYDRGTWSAYIDARHSQAKKAADIDSTAYLDAKVGQQFAPPSFTTVDAGAQWRLAPDMRLNVALTNLTDRKYWLWPDVHGRAAGSRDLDAYTQSGRAAKITVVKDF